MLQKWKESQHKIEKFEVKKNAPKPEAKLSTEELFSQQCDKKLQRKHDIASDSLSIEYVEQTGRNRSSMSMAERSQPKFFADGGTFTSQL